MGKKITSKKKTDQYFLRSKKTKAKGVSATTKVPGTVVVAKTIKKKEWAKKMVAKNATSGLKSFLALDQTKNKANYGRQISGKEK